MSHAKFGPFNPSDQTSFQTCILRRMREPSFQSLCDVTIKVEDHRFAAHRAILCGASDVLRSLLSSDWKETKPGEVNLNFVTVPSFACVLEFIYTGKLNISTDKLLEAHSAAKLLLIEPLEQKLRSVVLKQISVANVFEIGKHAWLFDNSEMEQRCEQFICANFEEIASTQDFLQLSAECVRHFVASSDLVLRDGEVSVLKAITKWARFEPKARSEQFSELLHLVRFADMAPEELEAILAASGRDTELGRLSEHALEEITSKASGKEDDNHSEAESLEGATTPSANVTLAGDIPLEPRLVRNSSRGGNAGASLRASNEGSDRGGPRFRVPRRCVRNIRFDMVVRNLAQLSESSQSINSPWYKCGGELLWRLEIYPGGSSPELSEYVSVFLRCADESASGSFDCSANFSLFLVEQNFGGQERIFEATKSFTFDEPCWGRSKYIRRADLLEQESALHDDSGNIVIGASVTW